MTVGRDERGFTLVELLVALVIVGIIVPVMSQAIFLGLRTSVDTADRLTISADPKLAGLHLVPDIQSADDVSTTVPACATGVAGTHLISFSWTQDTTDLAVTYQTDTAQPYRLRRYECRDGAVQQTTATVMQHVGTLLATCVPSCGAAGRVVAVDASACLRELSGACKPGTVQTFEVRARSRDQA